MVTKEEFFYKEFILGIGFLSGLWISIGINPEAVLFDTLLNTMETLNSDSSFPAFFYIIPTLGTITSIALAYQEGKIMGLMGIIVGFLAGLILLTHPMFGIILVVSAAFIGRLAVNDKYDFF
jgi:uncharacterized membrane protein HdeD (DUF308 family)